jgi:hypothetical protein
MKKFARSRAWLILGLAACIVCGQGCAYFNPDKYPSSVDPGEANAGMGPPPGGYMEGGSQILESLHGFNR